MKELSNVDIRHFKLSSGDDVISMVSDDQNDVVVLSQPLQVHSVINNDTQAYYFTDWQPLSKINICAVSKLHIISFVECANDVKEKYIRMCLETNDTSDIRSYIDNDIDEMDVELDEYLSEPPDDGNPTIH